MGQPPRLTEILLPSEKSIVYFVTLCVKERRDVLANPTLFEAIHMVLVELRNWRVLAGVVMPDHVHFVITPAEERGLSVGDFTVGFKRLLRKRLPAQSWEWQRGCFDRLLRSEESLHDKWNYVHDNPVRAGLVSQSGDWPYYIDLIDKEGSYQLPLQRSGKS
ncbi:MAG: REP-associated tyrosine transposase [Verrucomicrobiota bacterium]|jgi:putative transposase